MHLRFILLALPLAASATVTAPDVELARLAAERRALTQQFALDEAACQERFVVTPCVNEVRARRRQALAPLRARELELDEQQRRERALQRQAAREARMARSPQAQAAASAPGLPPKGQPSPTPPTRVAPPMRNHAADAQARAALAAERAQAQSKRRQEVQQGQADIARRLAERQAGGKKAQGLPPPDADGSQKR